MPAISYKQFGPIASVYTSPSFASSVRGRSRAGLQTFNIECDPNNPVTATVTIQGTVDPPLEKTKGIPKSSWADITKIQFTGEGGTIFVEIEIEAAQLRIVVKDGDYTSGTISKITTMI